MLEKITVRKSILRLREPKYEHKHTKITNDEMAITEQALKLIIYHIHKFEV